MVRAIALCLALLLPQSCLGDITLHGPDKVAVGERFEVDVEGLQILLSDFQGKSPPQFEWKAMPTGSILLRSHLELKVVVDTKGKRQWVVVPYASLQAANKGNLALVLMLVQKGVGELASYEVVVGGENPNPDPPPPPPPPPPPEDEPWGALLLYETGQPSPELAELLTSKTVREFSKSNGLEFLALDKDAKGHDGKPVPILQDWGETITGKDGPGVPGMVLIGKQGTTLWVGKPPRAKDYVALVQKYMKKKTPKKPREKKNNDRNNKQQRQAVNY